MVNRLKNCKIWTILLFFLLVTAFAFASLPTRALAAPEAAAQTQSINENLIVKYGMDGKEDDVIKAYTWNTATQSYVEKSEADATVNAVDGGIVAVAEGVEGTHAMSFTKKSRAEATFQLPAEADGMTVSLWVKNVDTYWSALVEFWNGADGGKFGKGSMMSNGGNVGVWGSPGNSESVSGAEIETGAGWDSFCVTPHWGDEYGETDDRMKPDTWYQVTYVVTETNLKAYRDGVLKLTYTNKGENVVGTLQSILRAAKSNTCHVGIRSGTDSISGTDIVDDFRIYSGAMDANAVQTLYSDYAGIRALEGRNVTIDGQVYTVNNGNNVIFESASAEFPEILIGNVAAGSVTKSGATYSATGTGFSYTYTVEGTDNDKPVATVVYTNTASNVTHTFTATQVKVLTYRLTSLKYKVNGGEAQEITGFRRDVTEYTLALSPDCTQLEFEATVSEEGSSNLDTVNAAVNLNGANQITASGENGNSTTYTVTLSRARADQAAPTLQGMKIGNVSGNLYVSELPAQLAQTDIVLAYPNGSEIKDFSYTAATHVLSFKVVDKLNASDKTAYSVTLKSKQEANVAYWSFDSGKDGNKIFSGRRWDAAQGKYVVDDSLDMTVFPGDNNQATSSNKTPVAAKLVEGVAGNAIELGKYQYTIANVAPMTTTGFTFSTWMKLDEKIWEAVVAVCDTAGTKGVILEKGNMQSHAFENGQPLNGWSHLADTRGVWENSSLETGTETGDLVYFNVPSQGAKYVFYTVTVSYVNGVGTVKFYKDGELAVTHHDNQLVNEKARIMIEAVNEGASFGLHRHHYDSGDKALFDETNIYAYEMTADEIRAAYALTNELNSVERIYDVEGVSAGYPDLLLGGATSVTAEGGRKLGVTSNGISYSYVPLTGEVSKAKDDEGVQVTLSKAGVTRNITVQYRRSGLPAVRASKLGYRIGGEAYTVNAPANAAEEVIVNVPASLDLTAAGAITAGNTLIEVQTGTLAEQYNAKFTFYPASDDVRAYATVECSYLDYTAASVTYTLRFKVASSAADVVSMTVSGGRQPLTLTAKDFTENTAEVLVTSLEEFTLEVTAELSEGATLAGGETLTLTAKNLVEGKLAIVVRSEAGTEKTYYLKPIAQSSDATLSALSAGSYQLSPAFDAGVTEYTLEVKASEAAQVLDAISATKNHEGATVTKKYSVTDGKIIVAVTAEDGVTVKNYVIAIVDTDATLSAVAVGGVALEGFDAATLTYTVKYKGEIPAVTATAASAKASVSVGSADANGTVTITVTAENKATKEYKITFVKLSADATLAKLTLGGTEIVLNNGAGEYRATAGTKLKNIAVVATPTDEGASVSHEADEANGKIVITVTAEDGTVATYTVTVIRGISQLPEEGKGESEDNVPVQKSGCGAALSGTAVTIVGAAVLLAGVCIVLKKDRKAHEAGNEKTGGEFHE